MSDPRRFLLDPDSSSPGSLERELLESWKHEQPSSSARARALAIGGLAAGAATVAGASATAGAAGAAAPKAAGLTSLAVLKWGVVGLLVAGAATAAVVGASASPKTAPVAATAGTVPFVTPAPTSAPVSAKTAAEIATVAATDLPAAPVTPSATVAATATVAPTPHPTSTSGSANGSEGSTLAEEIAAFDRVHAAFDSGETDRALSLVDAYERRYPTGTFQQEAEVVRVESLAKKGDRAQAARIGQRFLAAHPASPHAARIRAIVDASSIP